jgi:hypothetical protein
MLSIMAIFLQVPHPRPSSKGLSAAEMGVCEEKWQFQLRTENKMWLSDVLKSKFTQWGCEMSTNRQSRRKHDKHMLPICWKSGGTKSLAYPQEQSCVNRTSKNTVTIALQCLWSSTCKRSEPLLGSAEQIVMRNTDKCCAGIVKELWGKLGNIHAKTVEAKTSGLCVVTVSRIQMKAWVLVILEGITHKEQSR